ncbi:hypothetical protein N9L12_06280 [Luminiphilus sp.]|nr:hypothetical protein [Luminiphilus sp.]
MTTDGNTSFAALSGFWRAFIQYFHQYKFFLLGCLLFPPLLATGAGPILMGLLAHGASKEIDS